MADRSGAVNRLSAAALTGLVGTSGVEVPAATSIHSTPGILHLGIGAFHRAHQAVITEDAAMATGDLTWGIVGATQRSAAVRDDLHPQDCLYGVLEQSDAGSALRIVGQVREVLSPTDSLEQILEAIAAPQTRVVTLTVTEKGYTRNAHGGLDLAAEPVAHDLAGSAEPRSSVGRLVRGLQRRMESVDAPINVVCCDNLPSNGVVLRRLVGDFVAALPTAESERLGAWIEANVAFPTTMVDRIVPATTEADRAAATRMSGVQDRGLVVAEPFSQWVVQDWFTAERPAWEQVGAELTDDVEPYEHMKLRILNGSHSTLAYLGALAGHETIAETMDDDRVRGVAEALISDDVIPTLAPAGGTDFARYGATVLERYRNPNLRHRTVQIAMDGSQKLPQRLLGTVRDRLAAGAMPLAATTGVAAWMTFVAAGRDVTGRELPLDDPMAARLASVRGSTGAAQIVDDLLGVEAVFGADLPDHQAWRQTLRNCVDELLTTYRK